jgi:DNA-binding response OmpR family regulator
MRFVHVEPNHDYRRIIGNRLVGHELVSCATLDEARQALQGGEFDLVICNDSVDAPGDGWKWTSELQSQGQTVLVLTAFLREADVPTMSKLGVVTEQSICRHVR